MCGLIKVLIHFISNKIYIGLRVDQEKNLHLVSYKLSKKLKFKCVIRFGLIDFGIYFDP